MTVLSRAVKAGTVTCAYRPINRKDADVVVFLNELQAAVAAGFTRWIHFQRTRRADLFPVPARETPGEGPR